MSINVNDVAYAYEMFNKDKQVDAVINQITNTIYDVVRKTGHHKVILLKSEYEFEDLVPMMLVTLGFVVEMTKDSWIVSGWCDLK